MTLLEEIYKNKDINEIYDNCKWTNTLLHWKKVKEEYTKKYWPNTIIFYQVGSFFETYFHDALLTSKLIWQTLTSKDKKNKYAAPMAGSPKYSYKEKVKKLLWFWYNIIIVEEVWVKQKKWFDREITQILTPWTNLDNIWNNSNDYVYNFCLNYDTIWISILDVSSNKFFTLEINKNQKYENKIKNLFSIYEVKEITINKTLKNDIDLNNFLSSFWKTLIEVENSKDFVWTNIINNKIRTLKELNYNTSIKSINLILGYVVDIHKTQLSYINDIEIINPEDYFFLDDSTITNLELFKNTNGWKQYSLFNIINNTSTSFWNRMLKQQLKMPLKNKKLINDRLELVDLFYKDDKQISKIITLLHWLDDIERLASKIITLQCNPNVFISIKNSISNIILLKEILTTYKHPLLSEINAKIDDLREFYQLVDVTIRNEWWTSSREWNIIKEGVDERLDNLIKLWDQKEIEKWYKELENKLKKETGIKQIKISENNFWPFIEVKAKTQVPDNWKKIKMLKDWDRYETNELVDYYRQKLDIQSKRNVLEYSIFEKLRIKLSFYINDIQKTAIQIWLIDIAISNSILAHKNNYSKPIIDDSNEIFIEQGRHPVVETITDFIPNNTIFTNKNLHLVTWPNMGWKSTYIRQIALILLLSHIWSFTPSKKAIIGIIDWIYTRVWATDNLSEGESTFFVEMNETANILNQSNKNSFIVLDEIGRGTSTEDWYAISQSICEYIMERKTRTIFATHYHELNKLEKIYNKVENYHVDADLHEGNITFNHLIKKGWTNKSYWIEIWKLANLPNQIIDRAKQIKNLNK